MSREVVAKSGSEVMKLGEMMKRGSTRSALYIASGTWRKQMDPFGQLSEEPLEQTGISLQNYFGRSGISYDSRSYREREI